MDFKGMVDVSNLIVATMQEAMNNMGLNGDLILAQVKNAIGAESIQNLMVSSGIKIEGTDVTSVLQSWKAAMNELGAAQRCEIVSNGSSEIVVDLGECVFAPATAIIRGDDKEAIPPCPFIGMLSASLTKATGKVFDLTRCQFKPEMNTSIFTLVAE
ncbi:MAG: hypothetical protein ACW98Y_08300 [Candidatus Thorarchaeota archaeon]|jgi:hypothetical protein